MSIFKPLDQPELASGGRLRVAESPEATQKKDAKQRLASGLERRGLKDRQAAIITEMRRGLAELRSIGVATRSLDEIEQGMDELDPDGALLREARSGGTRGGLA
jgi:hypothetical protein